jgi:hypothetical protein
MRLSLRFSSDVLCSIERHWVGFPRLETPVCVCVCVCVLCVCACVCDSMHATRHVCFFSLMFDVSTNGGSKDRQGGDMRVPAC